MLGDLFTDSDTLMDHNITQMLRMKYPADHFRPLVAYMVNLRPKMVSKRIMVEQKPAEQLQEGQNLSVWEVGIK